jgi:toxin HigB-1
VAARCWRGWLASGRPYSSSPGRLGDIDAGRNPRHTPVGDGSLAKRNVPRFLTTCPLSRDALHCSVIKSFADKRTEVLFVTGTAARVAPDLARRALRKLEYVHLATRLDDLRVPPGNRLEALRGDRRGQHSIRVNDQWRICFRFDDGDAFDVEFCDYHS